MAQQNDMARISGLSQREEAEGNQRPLENLQGNTRERSQKRSRRTKGVEQIECQGCTEDACFETVPLLIQSVNPTDDVQ